MEITLTKTRTYKLEPYGKFCFKWKSHLVKHPHHILILELNINHDTAMPMSKDEEKAFVKEMKKFKTDVFTDGEKYYTLTNSGMTEISHRKLYLYKSDEGFRNAVDSTENFR